MKRRTVNKIIISLLASSLTMVIAPKAFADVTILNVSYDPTRELYKEFNDVFAAKWKADTGETVTIQTSHGGSGKQARAVIDGLDPMSSAGAGTATSMSSPPRPEKSRPTGAPNCQTIPRPTHRPSCSLCAG